MKTQLADELENLEHLLVWGHKAGGRRVEANVALYKPAPFDAERDLAVDRADRPRAGGDRGEHVRAPRHPPQLVTAARAKPDSLAYATPGNGTTPHMAVELFAKTDGIDLRHVPYRGGAQATQQS